MNQDKILDYCKRTPDVGAVKHEDFADYVIAMQQRKKTNDGWVSIESPYMQVDGKVAMAVQDHIRQDKRLDFKGITVLTDNDEQLTLMVTIVSEMYGERHGIATSRKIGGTAAEREFPWEVAETSAIGRALSLFGYGLFPGAGLASAEDIARVGGSGEHDDTGTRAGSRPGSNGNKKEEKQSGAPSPAPATATKAVKTGRVGVCPTHNEPTEEFKKGELLGWGHMHGTEKCNLAPEPQSIQEAK